MKMVSVNYKIMVLGHVLAIKLTPWHKGDVLGLPDPEYERATVAVLPFKMT